MGSMTLGQVRDWHLARAREQRNIGCSVGVENHKGMADAIDAHIAGMGEPVAYQSKRRPEDYPDEWRECSKETFDTIKRMKDSPWIVRELFDRPPAQAVQPCEKCKGRGEVFNDVHVRMMTCPHCHGAGKVVPAKPAAQVEDEDMDAQLTVMIEHLTSLVESQAAEPVAQAAQVANPLDLASGPEGEWYCEEHPQFLQKHDGCGGAGIPSCARIPLLLHQIRQLEQRNRELVFQYGFLAEQATAEPVAQGEPVAGIQVPREGLPRVAQFIPYPAWLRLPPGIHDLFTTPPAQPASPAPDKNAELPMPTSTED